MENWEYLKNEFQRRDNTVAAYIKNSQAIVNSNYQECLNFTNKPQNYFLFLGNFESTEFTNNY